jgi:photosystem II stability/assembly factor-like uncharacterized protein
LYSSALALAFVASQALTSAVPAQAQTYPASALSALHWRLIGPFRGGRAIAVTGVPGQPEKFYFGSVGGGVWESNNAGRTWLPIFDGVSVASIGAIAVAPSDTNVIYVGTGEADMRSDIQHGDGMYRSADAGKTWSHIGLTDTRQIGKIVVDPKDANIVYVAALGHQYGPNAERGVFKSTDGGQTWSKVLYKDENTGAIDLAIDPADPSVLFASLWQTRRPPWNVYPPSNGPSSGLFKSTDGGATWSQITGNGFPSKVGHIGISISPANHNRIYTLADTNEIKTGGVYRSDDGGATWTKTDGETRIWNRGWYFSKITADPKNADEVYVMNTSTYRSTDGGKSFTAIKGAPGGDDYHQLWIYPDDPNRMILGSDQGVVVSIDGAKTWSSWYNQPTGQFYHVITDSRNPYWVYGAQQDSGAMAVPSRSTHRGISFRDWRPISAGGESGTIAPDPLHPARLYDNSGTYEDIDTGWQLSLDPTEQYPDRVWRDTWTLPIAVSPQNPRVLYTSHQEIFRSGNSGNSWTIISPDLTRKTTTVPANLDPATIADSTGLPRRGVVYWLAPSTVRAHEIWAGTDDGLIWITRDEGSHWLNVTPPQLTPWSKVGVIDASHFDAATAYAAIDRHRLDDNHPYIYKTHDFGAHWTAITNGIPAAESVNVVREDPKRRGLLYAGTERAVYVSFDDGSNWQSLQLNLPAASMRDIVFNGPDIVLATHGRAFWILDDASPLRQLNAAVTSSSAHLFKPALTYRWQPSSDEGTPIPPDEPTAENPSAGASIYYYIGYANTPVQLQVLDASGRVLRQWSSSDAPVIVNPKTLNIPAFWIKPQLPPSSDPGLHRYVWDLHYSTPGATRRRGGGPLAPPGRYTVRLNVNGASYVQPLTLAHNPLYPATNADLRAQYQLARAIEAQSALVADGQKRAGALLKSRGSKITPAMLALLNAVIGMAPKNTPDDSVGKPAKDFSSLRYIGVALQNLEGAIEGGDARPDPEDYATFRILQKKAASALRTLHMLELLKP